MKKKDLFENMPYMSPLTNRMEASKEKGFTVNFEVVDAETMINQDTKEQYKPQDVSIINHYRFEGQSDPGDSNILYEISASDHAKGMLVTPYGPDCPAHVADFVSKIPQMEKQHQGSAPDTKNAQKPTGSTH